MLNVKLNIKRIVEHIIQNYILKIKRIEYCYIWLAIIEVIDYVTEQEAAYLPRKVRVTVSL